MDEKMQTPLPEQDLTEEDYIILPDGRRLPIVLMTDKDGEPTEDPDKIHTLLAGTRKDGWYEFDLWEGSLKPVTYH